MDHKVKANIVSVKANYRLHKKIAIKLNKAIETKSTIGFSETTIKLLLKRLGKDLSQVDEALKIARDWHTKRFLALIFKHYHPTLTEQSGIELDDWVQAQVDNDAFILLDDCRVNLDPNNRLSNSLMFQKESQPMH